MICKESIITWFKELESYRRIDTMCSLLNMLLPFELRFLGTCLEELGRRDSQELRGIELRANNQQELSNEIINWQCGEPTDIKIRRKMALYLALIRSCNSSCVNELYKTLDGWGDRDFLKMTDLDTLQELLLVYSMANHHPAFSVEQRLKFGEIFMKIQENKLISGLQQQQQQQQLQQQHHQQNMISHHQNLHNMHGHHQQQTTSPQQIHSSIQVIPQGNLPIGFPQGPLTQIIPGDGNIQQQIAVDNIHHILPTNMAGMTSEYVVGGPHPNAVTWAIRPNLISYPPPQQQQQTSLEQQHPPQSSSPMLSQQSSPSNSRTTSPNRSTSNNMIQLQQQQQMRNQPQRVVLRNSRRPSTETTPPPLMVQQQQQPQIISLIGSNEISNLKEEVFINADGSISPFTRNGYTRGHHTIPRPSKTSIHLQQQQHHNQQQHQQQIQAYLAAGGGGGPASLPPSFTLPNSSLAYTLQNMTLIDVQHQQQQHNPSIIIENNLMTTTANSSSTTNSNILNSNRHKNNQSSGSGGNQTGIINAGGSGSDSSSSIGSTGELSPPETPTIIGTLTQTNNIRLTDQQQQQQQQHNNYSKQLNQRLNGRPDKLLTNVGGQATFLYAPINTTSPNQQYQQQIGNELIIQQQQSTIANNNNNNSQQQQNSTLNSNSSNNNLVTSTIVLTSPTSGLVNNMQQQLYNPPYYSPHLTPTQRATILTTCHNPQTTQSVGISCGGPQQQGQPGTFRHPGGGGFQIQPNGDILYPFPQGAAAGLPTFVQPITLRSSPSQTITTQTPSPSSTQAQQQLQQPIPLPTNPNAAALLAAASPFSTLTAGLGGKQILSCYNCGGQSHTGRDCHEASMEDATRGAIYKLDYSAAVAAAAAAAAAAASSSAASGNSSNSINSSSNISNLSSNNSSTSTTNISNSSSNISNTSNSSSGSGLISTTSQSATTINTTEITTDATSSPTSSSSSSSLS